MPVFLFVLSVVSFIVGAAIFAESKSAIHEIEGSVLFLIAAVLFSAAAIVKAIERLREPLEDSAKLTSPHHFHNNEGGASGQSLAFDLRNIDCGKLVEDRVFKQPVVVRRLDRDSAEVLFDVRFRQGIRYGLVGPAGAHYPGNVIIHSSGVFFLAREVDTNVKNGV